MRSITVEFPDGKRWDGLTATATPDSRRSRRGGSERRARTHSGPYHCQAHRGNSSRGTRPAGGVRGVNGEDTMS